MFGQVDDACTCNIEVGGVGDAVQTRLIYVASVFFARPGVKTVLGSNVFGRHFIHRTAHNIGLGGWRVCLMLKTSIA